MTIQEFVKNGKTGNWFEGLIYKKYIPFNIKQALVNSVLEQNHKEVYGCSIYDTCQAEIMLIMGAIGLYTNLTSESSYIEDYDLLKEGDGMIVIVECIEPDYLELLKIYNTTCVNLQQANSVEMVLARSLNTFNESVKDVVSTIQGITSLAAFTDAKS